MSSYTSGINNSLPAIRNFVKKLLPEMISYNYMSNSSVLSTEAKAVVQEISLFSKKSVITDKTIFMQPHEVLSYLLILKKFPEATAVLPIHIFYPFSENVLALAPLETEFLTQSAIPLLLQKYEIYKQPFYFFFKGK